MRTLIDLPGVQIDLLNDISRKEGRPRAAVIREAIAAFIAKRKEMTTSDGFGAWGVGEVDGMEYQDRVRGEW